MAKDHAQLVELVEILEPFQMATDLIQGVSTVTINSVVPVVLALPKMLLSKVSIVRYHTSLVETLLSGLDDRFRLLLLQLDTTTNHVGGEKCLAFGDPAFIIASAIKPKYSFRWLCDHPGTNAEKDVRRRKSKGNKQLNEMVTPNSDCIS